MPDPDDFDEPESDEDTESESYPRLSRKDIRALERKGKAHDDLTSENRTLKAEIALRDAGLGDLSEKRRNALMKELGDNEPTVDAVREAAVEFGWAEPIGQEELDAEDRITAAASGAGQAKGDIKPEDVAGWDMQKRLAYREANPEKFKALMRGEPVTT